MGKGLSFETQLKIEFLPPNNGQQMLGKIPAPENIRKHLVF